MAAKARRRRSYFDRRSTLACYIASGSDIDDILPMLTGFQIEWNKLHRRLRGEQARAFLQAASDEDESLAALAAGIGIEAEDLDRLRRAWGELFWTFMRAMAERAQEPARTAAGRLAERLPPRHPGLVGARPGGRTVARAAGRSTSSRAIRTAWSIW